MLPDELVRSLVSEWGLRAGGVERPMAGTMNEVLLVTTDAGRVVLRGHRHRDRSRVDFEHAVMAFARAGGVPVPDAISTPLGEAVIERNGRCWSLFEHARGHQIPRAELDDGHAASMGLALAETHAVLCAFPVDEAHGARRHPNGEETLRGIEQLLARLAGIRDPGEHEEWAVERLRTRAAWLRRNPGPGTVMVGAEQVVHGDYQDTNLFFEDRLVSSIIDWDKSELRSPAEEAIRTMHLSLCLDPILCCSFLAGYRSVSILPDDQLDNAAIVYGYRAALDLWLYETIYLKGDERPRRFLSPGPFVPFLEQWEPLRESMTG